MIPRPLNEITWDDLEKLKDAGREEDFTIEFKAAFSGGSDFIALNDAQRAKAVDSIAKEAIAFLNGRGGDILIGARERQNDNPVIEEFVPVPNVSATVDRLAQALAAVIEPAQALIELRSIQRGDEDEGVVVVRVQSSLRAPHRSKRTKECYIRRGRESVPMPMDEIQDVAIQRNFLLRERQELLDRQFGDFSGTKVGRTELATERFHVRLVFAPLLDQQFRISSQLRDALSYVDPILQRGSDKEQVDRQFHLYGSWKPTLRGSRLESFERLGIERSGFWFISCEIKENGVLVWDFSCQTNLSTQTKERLGVFFGWICSFLACGIVSICELRKSVPVVSSGVIRLGFYSFGNMAVQRGSNFMGHQFSWPDGMVICPDFPVNVDFELNQIFAQMQKDAASIAGFEFDPPYHIVGLE